MLACCSTASIAQFTRGAKIVEGSLNIANTSGDYDYFGTITDHKSRSFSLMPRFGYFVRPNLVAGMGLGYESNKFTFDHPASPFDWTKRAHTLIIAPYLQKYISVSDKLHLTIKGSGYIGQGWIRESQSKLVEYDGKISVWGVRISPGVMYLFSQRLAINAVVGNLGYEERKEDIDKNSNTRFGMSEKGFDLSLNANTFFVGVTYIILNTD
jgi:hypothetical protein